MNHLKNSHIYHPFAPNRLVFLFDKKTMSLVKTIDQRTECYSLNELKQIAESIEKLISKFPFLSDRLKGKISFYKQKLDFCKNENDLYFLSQELLADFNDHQKGSLGELIHEMTKGWGAKLVLKKLGLKKGNDPMVFIRNKLYKLLEKIDFAEADFTNPLIGSAKENVGSELQL